MKKKLLLTLVFILGGSMIFYFSGKEKILFSNILSLSVEEKIVKENTTTSSKAVSENNLHPNIYVSKKIRDIAIVSGSIIIDQYQCLEGNFSGTRLINVRYQVKNVGNIQSSNYFAYMTTPYIYPNAQYGIGTPLSVGSYVNWVHGINLPGGMTTVSIKVLPTTITSTSGLGSSQIPGLADRTLDQRPQNNSIDIKITIVPCL